MSLERSRTSEYPNSRFKRAVDVCAVSPLIPFALTTIGVVGVAIKQDDGGDIFFTQERVGKDGELFTMYKLRTYNTDGEKTNVGKSIRPYGIDELPQLLNILKGEMSLFGIRALREEEFDRMCDLHNRFPGHFDEAFVHLWAEKYKSARPGGLSLAVAEARSVFNREFYDPEELHRKMELDIYQIDHESLLMDLKIVATIFRRALGIGQSFDLAGY